MLVIILMNVELKCLYVKQPQQSDQLNNFSYNRTDTKRAHHAEVFPYIKPDQML